MAKFLVETKDTKSFWKIIKEIQGTKFKKGTTIRANDFAQYFAIQFNPPRNGSTIQYAENFIECNILDTGFEITELKYVLAKCKENKAPGLDGIPYEHFKNAPDQFLAKLVDFYDKLYRTAEVPNAYKKSIIFPIHKRGTLEDVTNYRAISFSDAILKIFCNLLLTRLNKVIKHKNLLSENQAGFREGYSTNDHIFTLTSMVKIYQAKKKSLYAMFIDFKSAFDGIDRNALYYKLNRMGISSKFLKILKSLYENTHASVWNGFELSEEFPTTTGLKQGCVWSPILFSLYVDDIAEGLPGGASVLDLNIKILLYADDMVILAETVDSLQLMINRLSEYCKKWNLQVNLEKTKIMVFKNGGKLARREKWHLRGERIEVVKEYKYLGINVTSTLNWKRHIEVKYRQAVSVLNTTWKNFMLNKNVMHSTKYHIFQSVIRSIVCYAAQVWGYMQFEDVEKLQKFFIKRLFKLPINTPGYMIYVETGLAPMYLYTMKIHADYILKIMKGEENRITRKLAEVICTKNILYIEEWQKLAEEIGMNIDLNIGNINSWKDQIYYLIKNIDTELRKTYVQRAKNSDHRHVYISLNHELKTDNYFHDRFEAEEISRIFKVRGELLTLNFRPHIETQTSSCTLCNLNKVEDSIHFLSECPVLSEIRKVYFGKTYMNREESAEILNGRNWKVLSAYVGEASIYRRRIIDEFC